MSNCGYYKIHKGVVECTHPTYSQEYNSWSNKLSDRCDVCRRECGGIYPSQIPKADQTGWIYDLCIVERKSINGLFNGYDDTIVIKSWKEGDNVLYEKKE